MPKVYESSESANKDYLKTHYYKAMLDPMMEAAINILEGMGCKVIGINHDYYEIAATNPKYDITLKIFQYAPNETALDFFIDSRILFDLGRTKRIVIDTLHNEFKKKFDLKGVALHP